MGPGTGQSTLPGAAQGTSLGNGRSSTTGKSTSPPGIGPDDTSDPMARLTEHGMENTRNIERQKKLVEDTEKLLALANQLKEEVDKSTKDMLSLDVVRKADEIEKLAHSVKEKMKGT
jgi:hypothetical protein